MDATISVVCYKSKVLSNGESPIMVRVAKDGKRSMKSLGVSVNPVYWDFAKKLSQEEPFLVQKVYKSSRECSYLIKKVKIEADCYN